MLSQKAFGDAGAQMIIEEFIQGEEVSFIVLCDGLQLISPWQHRKIIKHEMMAIKAPTPVAWVLTLLPPLVTQQLHR